MEDELEFEVEESEEFEATPMGNACSGCTSGGCASIGGCVLRSKNCA